jgi:hypothetical protein
MRNMKEWFTAKRAVIAVGMVAAVVAPSLLLYTLTAKSTSTNVDVGQLPASVTRPTTATSTSVPPAGNTTAAESPNPFGTATTVAPAPPPTATTVPAPPSGPGLATSYAFATFSQTNADKSPIRWSSSPAAMIRYSVNYANAPAGAAADLALAIATIKAAGTGLNFVADPVPATVSTDNAGACPSPTCWFDNVLRTGAGNFPPVLIGWSPATAPIMAGGPTGRAFGQTVLRLQPTSKAGYFELVSGVVAFSTVNLPSGFGGSSRGAVMLHQLGLLVGLASVTDADQMMYPKLNGHLAVYGAGDLAGLRLAGQGVDYDVKQR